MGSKSKSRNSRLSLVGMDPTTPSARRYGRVRLTMPFGRLVWLGLAAVCFVTSGYVTIDALRIRQQSRQQLAKLAQERGRPDPAKRQRDEGRDESTVSSSAIDNYRVAPHLPRILSIKRLKLQARMVGLGVNPDGSMQAPINIYDAGWYVGGAAPGEPGAVVINAHASGPTREGLFAYLDSLNAGDKITIETGDGHRIVYKTTKIQAVAATDIKMKDYLEVPADKPQILTLITCSGNYLKDRQTYDKRVVVSAERIS